MSFELMADDAAALIAHLGLENADLLGYSLGGGVALQTAIRHPESVRIFTQAGIRGHGVPRRADGQGQVKGLSFANGKRKS